MVSTRRTARSNSMESRGSFDQASKIPLAGPPSVLNVFLMVYLHLCKTILFFETHIRILAYLIFLFALSGIFDVSPRPQIFFPITNKILNVYFVKYGWFWTLLLTAPFLIMTSYTYCCGKKEMVCRHLVRLGVATAFWFFWVNLFIYIEGWYGSCKDKNLKIRSQCLKAGSSWKGFDLSGHAFILIYSNLILIEEARPILGWESISDLIREETYTRKNKLASISPLRNLTAKDFDVMQTLYDRFLPYVRLNFIVITCLSIVWDVMLLSTIIHFHTMPEKLLSGLIAISSWFCTYRLWYKSKNLGPLFPGEGSSFQYYTEAKIP